VDFTDMSFPTGDKPPPPAGESRSDSTVRLFRIELTVDSSQLEQYRRTLSDEERQRADRLRTADLARRFIVGRGVLKRLLGEVLHIPPGEVRFEIGPHGKPALAGDLGRHWQFNVSHTGDLALIAFARGRALGVDIESRTHRIKRDELAARFFSAAERQAYFELPDAQRPDAFYRIWTCKEAYLKAIGAGLSFPLGRFSVSVRSDQPPGLLHVDGQSDEPSRWAFVLPNAWPHAAAALVVEGHGWTLESRVWNHATAPESSLSVG
jgi:4'-phosphopantetheinyl transferase